MGSSIEDPISGSLTSLFLHTYLFNDYDYEHRSAEHEHEDPANAFLADR